jgi:hypothetical protein
MNDISKCQYWLSQFEFAELNQHIYNNSNFLFPKLGKKIIASFDSEREPLEDEIVIVYGNYPDWHHALPYSSKVFRHASLFNQIKHDKIEYDSVWESVDIIYILNLKERSDRFNDTLLALCSVKAPIHRIHHYKAEKDGLPPYVGATKNHVDVMKHFKETEKNNCLILEDDIVFIDDHKLISESLKSFFTKKYTYNICFLSLSKHGERQPYDDLLSITKLISVCTCIHLPESFGFVAVRRRGQKCCFFGFVRLVSFYFGTVKLPFQHRRFKRKTPIENVRLSVAH